MDSSISGGGRTMLAVFTLGNGEVELRSTQVPRPGAGQVLVKVSAAAQNPTDWKTIAHHRTEGAIVGCDFAGVVVELGANVNASVVQLGERVAGFVHGSIKANGSFAEYVVVPTQILIRIPRHWTFEQAAQLGVACFTACQCLYQSQSLPMPSGSVSNTAGSKEVLVWSGTSSVGHFAIQLAKLAGLQVITTASPKHFDRVKSLGADSVIDYRDPRAGQQIHVLTQGRLKHAVDCISERTTPFQVSQSLSTEGGTISIVNPYESRKKGVNTAYSLAYALLGEGFQYPLKYEPNDKDIEFGTKAGHLISRLLAEGKLMPAPIRVFPRGLASVSDGLKYMKEDKVSAEKIIYCISDTPGIPGGS